MSRRNDVWLVVMLAMACARNPGHAPAPVVDVGPPIDAPYVARVLTEKPAHQGTLDDAAAVLGIPMIGRAALPDGFRELRVGDAYSMMPGSAEPVLRLVEQAGRAALGQVIFVWHERMGRPRFYRETTCTPWTDSTRVCAFVSPAALDWTSVAARLDALGAWTVRAACEADPQDTAKGSMRTWTTISDAGDLHLGRIVGGKVDTYVCNAPRYRGQTDEGRTAKALYEYFRDVAKQAGTPPAA